MLAEDVSFDPDAGSWWHGRAGLYHHLQLVVLGGRVDVDEAVGEVVLEFLSGVLVAVVDVDVVVVVGLARGALLVGPCVCLGVHKGEVLDRAVQIQLQPQAVAVAEEVPRDFSRRRRGRSD